MRDHIDIGEFIQRGGKIEFTDSNMSFHLKFPNGFHYCSNGFDLDQAFDHLELNLLSRKYEELFCEEK